MIIDSIRHGEHVVLHISENNYPCLTADDYELYDCFDDYIREDCNYKIECLHYEEVKERTYYTMEFESGISFDELVYIIKKYDLEEIEKIYSKGRKKSSGKNFHASPQG